MDEEIMQALRDGLGIAWDKGKLTDKQYADGNSLLDEIAEDYS